MLIVSFVDEWRFLVNLSILENPGIIPDFVNFQIVGQNSFLLNYGMIFLLAKHSAYPYLKLIVYSISLLSLTDWQILTDLGKA